MGEKPQPLRPYAVSACVCPHALLGSAVLSSMATNWIVAPPKEESGLCWAIQSLDPGPPDILPVCETKLSIAPVDQSTAKPT